GRLSVSRPLPPVVSASLAADAARASAGVEGVMPRASAHGHARRRGRPPIPGLRESILREAEAIFERRDFHEVQMDDVAAACHVGKGTLYRHFRSKRDLYLAITFEGIGRLRAELEAALEEHDSPARRVERIVRGTLTFFWDRRFFFALTHRHEYHS